MIYQLLKIPARIALWIYCRKLVIRGKEKLEAKGPLLIAMNHPNSLLDAVILSTIFRAPIHSLARGDAFKNPFYARLLRAIHMLPVYRISEGVENLEHNYTTFNACRQIFNENGIVLIFSEGRCENEWKLRPLKKGTARLAFSTWNDGTDLKILPVCINYHSFRSFGKNVILNFGPILCKADFPDEANFGKNVASFNNVLEAELKKLIIEIPDAEESAIKKAFDTDPKPWVKMLLSLPALAGYILHWPLYYPLQKIVYNRIHHTGHYDSVIIGSLFFLYPLYLAFIIILAYFIFKSGFVFLLLIAPLLAIAYVQWKPAFREKKKATLHKVAHSV